MTRYNVENPFTELTTEFRPVFFFNINSGIRPFPTTPEGSSSETTRDKSERQKSEEERERERNLCCSVTGRQNPSEIA